MQTLYQICKKLEKIVYLNTVMS